jgi:reactive intermediate/imine deaminase
LDLKTRRRSFILGLAALISPLFNKPLRAYPEETVVSNRAFIATQAAPQAIGPYSQGIKVGNTVWISGQIPLDPSSMTMIKGDIGAEAEQVFSNLSAVAEAAGGTLDHAVKINISLTDLGDFDAVNAVMSRHFEEPYPARACVEVAALPKGARIEVEAILSL